MIKKQGFLNFVSGTVFLLCPSVLMAANWNDPGVNLVQSISDHAHRDANTGQIVSIKGMPKNTTSSTSTNSTTSAPNTTTTTNNTPAAGNTGNAPANPGNTGNTSKTGGVKQTAATVGKVAGAAVGTAVGGYMVYESTKGNQQHNVGNLMGGVMGGVTAGAAIGTAVGSPGIGTAIGAVVGGAIAGSQLFSETDCLMDPETQLYTCCNTVFNKGQRQAKIGDYMFCASEDGKTNFIGRVRQCLQGESETKLSWWEGLWKDDHWTPECETRYCDGEVQPASGLDAFIDPDPDTVNFCWRWKCKDGLVRSGDKCLTADGSLPVDQYDVVINKIQQERQRLIGICGNM